MLTAYLADLRTAEELVQDALVRVCSDWDRVRSMDAWTTAVAFNLANSWFRRSSAARRARHRLAGGQVEPHEPDRDAGLTVLAALERLPDRQRQAVVLRFVDDRTIEDAAEIMGCAAGTVKAHTHRALAALRAMDLGLVIPDPDEPATATGRVLRVETDIHGARP